MALASGNIESSEPLTANSVRRGVVNINGQNETEIAALVSAPKSEKIAAVTGKKALFEGSQEIVFCHSLLS